MAGTRLHLVKNYHSQVTLQGSYGARWPSVKDNKAQAALEWEGSCNYNETGSMAWEEEKKEVLVWQKKAYTTGVGKSKED